MRMRFASARAPSVFCLKQQSLQVMTSVRPGSGRIQPQSGQKDGSATEKGEVAGFFLAALARLTGRDRRLRTSEEDIFRACAK